MELRVDPLTAVLHRSRARIGVVDGRGTGPTRRVKQRKVDSLQQLESCRRSG